MMKLTKYEHACVVIEDDGQKVIIDPSPFAASLQDVSNTVAVVITHGHMDHLGEDQIAAIVATNPDAQFFAPEDTVEKIKAPHVQAVKDGDKPNAGPFLLEFYGEKHALIHGNMPDDQNVGVLVNKTVYFPGDSFTQPPTGTKVPVLLAPVSGPWLKIGETMTFVSALKPDICIPTHDGMLSEMGLNHAIHMLEKVCQEFDGNVEVLKPGQSTEV